MSSTLAKRRGVYLGALVSSNRGGAGKHCIGKKWVWKPFVPEHPVICQVTTSHCWVEARAYPPLRIDSNGLLRIHQAAKVRKSMGALALVVKCPVNFVSTLLIIMFEVNTQKKLSSEVMSEAVWVEDTRELTTSVLGCPLKADRSKAQLL